MPTNWRTPSIFIAVAIAAAVILWSAIVQVPAGHRGVLLQTGKVKDQVLNEGLHIIVPFLQNVQEMEVRVRKVESAQTASSKDLQSVTTTVAVNYSLEPAAVNKLYQELGLEYQSRIVDPSVSESVKAVTAEYTAEQLITKRPEVAARVKESLAQKLQSYNMKLEEINITEFKFSDTFNKAIEAKQEAEQLALKAQRDLERIEIEAKQKITQAEAEAKSLQLKKQEVTADLVRLKEIEVQEKALEKWDGKLPQVTGGATPFIQLPGGTQ